MDAPGTRTEIEIQTAATPAAFEVARELFVEYAAQLRVDLCFQGFNAELTRLSEMYAAPSGRLLLAVANGTPVGCVGVRALASMPETAEMKRLYVRDAARGLGIGRRLAEASIGAARELGYSRMVLDTLDTMTAALRLYADLGFADIESYYPNPNAGVRYLGLTW